MSRSLLAAIGGLTVTVLLGVLGLTAESTNTHLAATLFVCALSVGGVVALALLATHLRPAATTGVAPAATGTEQARTSLLRVDIAPPADVDAEPVSHPAAPEVDLAPEDRAPVKEPVSLLAAVEAVLQHAPPEPANTAGATDLPDPAGPAAGEKAPAARSALLDALQELHEDELFAALDGVAGARRRPSVQGTGAVRE